MCHQRDLAEVASAAQAVAHAGDDPRRFIDLPCVAADHGGALRQQVSMPACQGDVKAIDAALDAQPLCTRSGPGVGLAGEGLAQRLGSAADARHHAAARAALDVVVVRLDAAV